MILLRSLISSLAVLALGVQSVFAMAVEPTVQPADMSFSNVTSWGFNLSFTASSADGFLVLRSPDPITFSPTDGVTYEKGQGVASGVKVVSTTNATNFNIRDVQEDQYYYFAVFAFNGTGVDINYLQTSPLIGDVRSDRATPKGYYNAIDASSPTFIADLTRLIQAHMLVSYTDFRSNIMPNIYERDTTGGEVAVNCEYTGEYYTYTPPIAFGSGSTQYSKEHRMCQSYFPSGTGTGTLPGADYHNLALVNYSKANAKRSNNNYGEVVTPTYTYLGGILGQDGGGKTVYEPMVQQKGNAARAFLYMMVCYDGFSGRWTQPSLLTDGPLQDINLLKTWSRNDLPDDFERSRNDYIHTIQLNRNPFIDYPDWIDCIDFTTLTKLSTCTPVVLSSNDPLAETGRIAIYPNQAKDQLHVVSQSFDRTPWKIDITDMLGRKIISTSLDGYKGENTIDIESLPSGEYFLNAHAGTFHKVVRFSVIK